MAARVAAAEAALQMAQNALRNATTFSEIQIQTDHMRTARTELMQAKQALRASSGNGFSATLGIAAMDSAFPQQANPQAAAQSVAQAAQAALFGNKALPSTTPYSWSAPLQSGGPSCYSAKLEGKRKESPVSTMSILQTSETAQAAAEVKLWLKTVNRNHNFFTRDVRKLITTVPTSPLLPGELLLELKKVVANLETIDRVKQIRDRICDQPLSIEEERAYMQARRNCSESGTRCLQMIEKNGF